MYRLESDKVCLALAGAKAKRAKLQNLDSVPFISEVVYLILYKLMRCFVIKAELSSKFLC